MYAKASTHQEATQNYIPNISQPWQFMALYIHTDPISKNIHTENQNVSHDLLQYETWLHKQFASWPGLAQDTDILDLE